MSGSRRRPGRLGPFVDGYRAWLLGLGYSPLSVTHSLVALGHLGRWMDRHDVDVAQLNSDVLKAFLADHVDRTRALADGGRDAAAGVFAERGRGRRRSQRDGARRLTGSLTITGAGWLLSGRSRLRPSAVTRGWHAGSSRNESRPRTNWGWRASAGADVTGFLLRESTRLRPGSVCCHANQLRQLLRYLSMRGFADPGLAEAVPSVGRWREAGIPRFPAAAGDRAPA